MEDNFFYVIIAAIMQGLTEFLPISSSGHLIIIKEGMISPYPFFSLKLIFEISRN